jgi:hypothetical protein
MVKGHLPYSPTGSAQSLGSQVLEDSQNRRRLTIVTENEQLQTNK